MKLWFRPVMVALWVTLSVTMVLAAMSIFTININNVTLTLSILALFAILSQFGSFMMLRNINPQWRRVRDDLAITIIIALALLLYVLTLSFILSPDAAAMALIGFSLLLLLTLALMFSLISIALYFVSAARGDNC